MNYEIEGELFIWDEIKAKKNWRKHGVHFEEAATVFTDPMLLIMAASRNDEARCRYWFRYYRPTTLCGSY